MAPIEHEALKRFKENYTDFKPDEVRLIDANALKEDIEMLRNKSCFDISEDLTSHDTVGFWAGFEYLAKFIDSATTVETTDDVMARLPKNFRYTFETKIDIYEAWTRDSDSEHTLKLGYGKTTLEAVKRLEESLNRK